MRSFCAVLGSSACPESIREEVKLRTSSLIINELVQEWEEEKNCAVSKQKTGILSGDGASIGEISPAVEMTGRIGQFRYRRREFYLAKVHPLGRFLSALVSSLRSK